MYHHLDGWWEALGCERMLKEEASVGVHAVLLIVYYYFEIRLYHME